MSLLAFIGFITVLVWLFKWDQEHTNFFERDWPKWVVWLVGIFIGIPLAIGMLYCGIVGVWQVFFFWVK